MGCKPGTCLVPFLCSTAPALTCQDRAKRAALYLDQAQMLTDGLPIVCAAPLGPVQVVQLARMSVADLG